MVSPASDRHEGIGSFLDKVLGIFVEANNLGRILRAPFLMRTPQKPSGREPDLMFVSRERLHLIKTNYLDGPADMVIEIVSPESIGRDRGEKFVEYEQAGIKEYWLIDPLRQSAEFYELHADGRYRMAVVDEGIYQSNAITGFRLQVEWLWQSPLPLALDVLRKLKVI